MSDTEQPELSPCCGWRIITAFYGEKVCPNCRSEIAHSLHTDTDRSAVE